MNNKAIGLLLLFTISSFVYGQQNTWPLQKCIDSALQNNLDCKIKLLEVKRTQKAKVAITNQLLPSINLFTEQTYNFGSTIDPATNARVSSNIQYDNFYINARMNLIDFNALANAQKSKIDIEKANADKEIIENEYKLQLLDSYYAALYTQELLKIQKEQLQNASFNLNRVTREVNIGSKPQSDLYDMQLSFSQEEKRILETEQLYNLQKLQLFQLINLIHIQTNEVLLVPYLETKSNSNPTAENRNPHIKFAQLNNQAINNQMHLLRANSLPVLSTYYTFSTFYYKPLNQPNSIVDNFNNQLGNNKNSQLGLQLSVPVFNGFRNHKKIAAVKIDAQKSLLAIEIEKQKLNKEIELESQRKKNYLQLLNKSNETLQYAKASFTTTQAKFLAGKTDAFVLMSVKNLLLSTSYEVLKNNLQLEYIDLKINLIKNNQLY